MSTNEFHFRAFTVQQDRCAMKVGEDAVLLGAWAPLPEPCNRILDIGTGTGILALLTAQRSPEAEVIGVEIDAAAATQAAENAASSPFAERIRVEETTIQDFARQEQEKFDLIISNPPFFSGGILSESLDRQTARHTVKLSHQDLLRSVQLLLAPTGLFCCILPKIEGLRFQELARSYQLELQQQLSVRPFADKSVNRMLLAFGRTLVSQPETATLVRYEAPGKWTPEYLKLARGYYANE